MDRKIYQAEEKSEAKRIKELEAMKDKKRQPEEKQQVGSLTQKITSCVSGSLPFRNLKCNRQVFTDLRLFLLRNVEKEICVGDLT